MLSRILCVSLFCLSLMLATAAQAHSVLVSSDPAANATVDVGTRTLQLVFDSRVDPKRSRLYLSQPDGKTQTLIPEAGTTKGTLTVQADCAAAGDYKLRYEVLSVDGHIARGSLPFSVSMKQ